MAQRRYLIINEKNACQVRIYSDPRLHKDWLFANDDAKYNEIMYSIQDLLTNKINTEGQPTFPKLKVPRRDFHAEKDYEVTVYLIEKFIHHYVFNKYQEAIPKKKADWRQTLADALRKEFGWTEKNGKGKAPERSAEEVEKVREKVRRQAEKRGDDTMVFEEVTGGSVVEGAPDERVVTQKDIEESLERAKAAGGLSKDMDERLKLKDQNRQKGPIKRRRIRTTDPRLKKQSEKELQPEHYASGSRRKAATVEEVDDYALSGDEDDLKRKRNLPPTEEEIDQAWESTLRNLPEPESGSDADEPWTMPNPGDDPAVLVDLIQSEEESEDEYTEEGEVKPKLRMAWDGYETFWKTICLIITKTDEEEKVVKHQRAAGREVEKTLIEMPDLNEYEPKDIYEEFGDFDLITPDGKIIREDFRQDEGSDDEDL